MGSEGPKDARRWVRWHVSGQVQHVGFRWFVQRAAASNGLVGDVCNLPDGRVEIRALGRDDQLRALLAEVNRGPRRAMVEGVEESEPEPIPRAVRFEIR